MVFAQGHSFPTRAAVMKQHAVIGDDCPHAPLARVDCSDRTIIITSGPDGRSYAVSP